MLHGAECIAEIRKTAATLFAASGAAGGVADTSALPRVQVQREELSGEGMPVVDLFLRLEFGEWPRRLAATRGACW